MKLSKISKEVEDFLVTKKIKHYLNKILVISLCEVLSGAEDCEEIAEYGQGKENFLRNFLELPKGIPSRDTFNRVLRHLDTASFSNVSIRCSKYIF